MNFSRKKYQKTLKEIYQGIYDPTLHPEEAFCFFEHLQKKKVSYLPYLTVTVLVTACIFISIFTFSFWLAFILSLLFLVISLLYCFFFKRNRRPFIAAKYSEWYEIKKEEKIREKVKALAEEKLKKNQ